MDKQRFLDFISQLIDDNERLSIDVFVPQYSNEGASRNESYACDLANTASDIITGDIKHDPITEGCAGDYTVTSEHIRFAFAYAKQ